MNSFLVGLAVFGPTLLDLMGILNCIFGFFDASGNTFRTTLRFFNVLTPAYIRFVKTGFWIKYAGVSEIKHY